ncbi:MAG: phosphatase PAP2 family protein [Lentimonas sp.]
MTQPTQLEKRASHLQVLVSGPCTLSRFGSDLKHCLLFFWLSYRLHWRVVAAVLVGTILTSIFIIRPFEGDFTKTLYNTLDPAQWKDTSEWISWSGEYLFSLTVLIALLVFGKLKQSRRLQVLAACLLVSFVIGSLTVRVGKLGFGRIRPNVAESMEIPDTFVGPTTNPKYHSFPSGHTVAAFATSTPIQLTLPVVGVPASLYACTIAVSRAYNKQHYLSDLFAGCIIGLLASYPTRRIWTSLSVKD